ncbi:MAG: 2-oxoacid:acceptor oxidoreductase family protein, partial [archaeon]|nr:2-oxoacid:acceptor oxidoreductase family protein [archaeon]
HAPTTKTAIDDIGLRIVSNIVMIGTIVKITKIVSIDAAKKAISDTVPKGTEDKNIQAFEVGYNLI